MSKYIEKLCVDCWTHTTFTLDGDGRFGVCWNCNANHKMISDKDYFERKVNYWQSTYDICVTYFRPVAADIALSKLEYYKNQLRALESDLPSIKN